METGHAEVTVDIIIPARNEEDCIGRCLQSLVAQQGISFQITVVDDGSTDHTRAIAESFPGVRVLSAGELKPGMTGKVNALITGAAGSSAEWLLFTDADTFHYPGSLMASVREAEEAQSRSALVLAGAGNRRLVGTGGDAAGFCRSCTDVFVGKNQ